MAGPLGVKEILEAVTELEKTERKPSGRLVAVAQKEGMSENDSDVSSQVGEQCLRSCADKEISSVPAFKQVSKSIYNTDIMTSKFDEGSGNDDSTSHFLFRPRPMTSFETDSRSVRYKYKTLSGSSAILRSRRQRSHESLEKEYRTLKQGIMEKTQPELCETEEMNVVTKKPEVNKKPEVTAFSNYIDSLWGEGKFNKKNGQLVKTKEIQLNFFSESDQPEPKITYMKR